MNAIQRMPKVIAYSGMGLVGALVCLLIVPRAQGTQPGAKSPAAPVQIEPEPNPATAKHIAELQAIVTDSTVILAGLPEVGVLVELHGLAEEMLDLAKIDGIIRSQARGMGLKVLSDDEFREALKTRHVPALGVSVEAKADTNGRAVDIFRVEVSVVEIVTMCRKPGVVLSAPIWSKSTYGDAPRQLLVAQMGADCENLLAQLKKDWSVKNGKTK